MDQTPYEHAERRMRDAQPKFWAASKGPSLYDESKERFVKEESARHERGEWKQQLHGGAL